jgi:hypothetical protein
MARRSRISVSIGPVLLALAVAGCPRPAPKRTGGTIVTVDGDPPDFPTGFTPGAPLPEPLPPDPGQFGRRYLEQVYPSLRAAWSAFLEDARLRLPPDHPLNSPTLETRVEIVVDRAGGLVEVRRLTGSGHADFDLVAEEIARDAAPLPAPPAELVSDDDRLYLTWLFARDRRQAGVATAEVRKLEWPVERAVPKLLADRDVAEAARRVAAAAPAGGDPSGPEGRQLLALTAQVMTAAVRDGLRGPDPAVQRLAVDAIVAVGAAQRRAGDDTLRGAASELTALIDGAVEISLRAAAATALGALGDRDAAPTLASILERDRAGNPELSAAAAAALVAVGAGDVAGEQLRGWLDGADRGQVAGALAALARAAVPGTTDATARHVTAEERGVRVAACGALGRLAGAGLDAARAWTALRKGLDDRDASVRAACARGAAVAGGAGATNRATYWKLIKLVKDKDDRVRAGAVLAAFLLEPVKAVKELGAIGKDQSPAVLAAYAEALAVVPAERGRPPRSLVALAGHADAAVRARAIAALARRARAGEAAAQEIAAGAIVDPELEVRLAALGAIDDPDALVALSSDAAPEIAAAAQVRRIVRLGRWAALPVATTAIAASPPEGADRVRIASAWLQAG